jgi:hypothetical protein
MVQMVNALTGSIMWVHESRVEEYLRRGHKLASPPPPPAKPKRPRAKKT